MLSPDLEKLLGVAGEAVDLAVDTLRSAVGPGDLTPKGDRDYASEIDFRIERQLRAHLTEATPDIGFLGEEEGTSGHQGGLHWALDPIDGTVNYVRDLPLFAVSLALIEDDQPVLGVIDMPTFGVRYRAAAGLGTFAGDRRLSCPPPPADLGSAIVAIGDYAVGTNAESKNRVRLRITSRLAATVLRVRMLGSAAIDLAWLAEGRLDASITLSNKTWDMAAGVVLARETGHQVVDAAGAAYSLASASTVAAHPAIVDDVVRHLIEGHTD